MSNADDVLVIDLLTEDEVLVHQTEDEMFVHQTEDEMFVYQLYEVLVHQFAWNDSLWSVPLEMPPFIQQCLATRRFALRLFVMSYENLLRRFKRRSGFCSHHELSLGTRDALGTQ